MEKLLPNSHGRYPCTCCHYYTLTQPGRDTRETCDVCYWINNAAQYNDRDLRDGENRPSLNEARRNYRKLKACEETAIASVRPPRKDEMPDAPKPKR